jgi:chromate transporter
MERSPSLSGLFARCALIGMTAFGPRAGLVRARQGLAELFGPDGDARTDEAPSGATGFDRAREALDVLPGAPAARLCALAGFKARGILGALAAFAGFCLPGSLLAAALTVLVPLASEAPQASLAFYALLGAAPVFCLSAALDIYRQRQRPPILAALALGAAGLFWLGLKPFSMLLGGAVIGVLMLAPRSDESPAPPAAYDWRLPAGLFALFALMAAGFFLADPMLGRVFLASAKAETWGLGGFGALAVFFADAVRVRHWLDQEAIAALLALTRVIPGPELALPVLAGHAARGWPGALAALAGTLGASFFLLLAAAPALESIRRMDWAVRAVSGLTAVLSGLCLGLAARLAWDAAWDAPRLAAAVAALACLAFRASPALAVLAAALAGMAAGC